MVQDIAPGVATQLCTAFPHNFELSIEAFAGQKMASGPTANKALEPSANMAPGFQANTKALIQKAIGAGVIKKKGPWMFFGEKRLGRSYVQSAEYLMAHEATHHAILDAIEDAE